MDITTVKELVHNDLKAVNDLITKSLESDVALINQLGHYIVNSGGKRMRPIIVLLCARALGYNGTTHHNLATIIEFIHTATLLHDDVVDASELRRGRETANAIWGNEASVLVGDFLYSRSFELMVEINNLKIMDILAHTTNQIAEGEVLQLMNCNDPKTTETRYLDVINRKTAKLFEAAAQLGAVVAAANPEIEQTMAAYGMHLGCAFQLIDDVLDYSASSEQIGKNVGDDLAEGKPTLPLIRAMQTCPDAEKKILEQAIINNDKNKIGMIIGIINNTDAISYTTNKAKIESTSAIKAIEMLPSSQYKEALTTIAEYTVSRTY